MLIALGLAIVGLFLMLSTGDCIPARRLGFVMVICALGCFVFQGAGLLWGLLPTSAELATITSDLFGAAKWLAMRVVSVLILLAMIPALIIRALSSGSK